MTGVRVVLRAFVGRGFLGGCRRSGKVFRVIEDCLIHGKRRESYQWMFNASFWPRCSPGGGASRASRK